MWLSPGQAQATDGNTRCTAAGKTQMTQSKEIERLHKGPTQVKDPERFHTHAQHRNVHAIDDEV
eukprot:6071170-Amphidinium_carterae.1